MNTITAKLSGYQLDTHTNQRGNVATCARNGSRLATLTEQADGSVAVALFIDYGTDGRSYCDGATYKTAAGAVRKAKGFLA